MGVHSEAQYRLFSCSHEGSFGGEMVFSDARSYYENASHLAKMKNVCATHCFGSNTILGIV